MQKAITPSGGDSKQQQTVHETQVALVTESLIHEVPRDMFGERRARGGITAETVATAVHTAVLTAVSDPDTEPSMAAEAGAYAARHALAALDVGPIRVGINRQGWRGRLAHIEMLLHEGSHATALREVRDMIDNG